MSDLAYTLLLIGGLVVLALVLRTTERWCETHPRRSDVRVGRVEQN